VGPRAIVWHDGPRAPLRRLFELADDSAEQIDSYIELGRVLVAVNDTSEIVGHAQLLPTDRGDTIELKSIAVVPDFQRRGIGQALVNRVLAICRSQGGRAVSVTTATADIDNIRFYQRSASARPRSSGTHSPRPRALHRGSRRTGSPYATASPFTLAFGANDTGD
jgi:ribosomal protein S18 acetylase RimI-like enzyme